MSLWKGDSVDRGLRMSDEFEFSNFMANPFEVEDFLTQGLPPDPISVCNAVILSKNRFPPFCIDPYNQVSRWIRKMEAANEINVIRSTRRDCVSRIRESSASGQSVLLQLEGGDLDHSLYACLVEKQNGFLSSTDNRIYIVTTHRNPSYSPWTSSRVCVLNFDVTEAALQERLLTIAIALDFPDREVEAKSLRESLRAKTRAKEDAEVRMIDFLSRAAGEALDSADGEHILQIVCSISNETEQVRKLMDTVETEIEGVRTSYRRFALRATVFFFAITSLSELNTMYHYSLAWFLTVFAKSVAEAQPSEDSTVRAANLEESCTPFLYKSICRSLYQEDHLAFSFLLCTRWLRVLGEMQSDELDFLIGSDKSFGPVDNPYKHWLPDMRWRCIVGVSQLRSTTDFSIGFEEDIEDWKAIYEADNPEKLGFPGRWARCSPLAKLLLTRAVRPDRMFSEVKAFVQLILGQQFTSAQEYELAHSFSDSFPFSPLIVMFSGSDDPSPSLFSLAERLHIQGSLKALQLGQGQGILADRLVRESAKNGNWAILQNCHYCPSWMSALENLCHELEDLPLHRDFRLWITSHPFSGFPISIVENGTKIVHKSPTGLRSRMKNLVQSDQIWSEAFFADFNRNVSVLKKLTLGETYLFTLYWLCPNNVPN